MAKKPEAVSQAELDRVDQEIIATIERAEAGDEKALPAVRDLFEKVPSLVGIFGGNLAKRAIDVLLAAMHPKQLAAQETIRIKMAELRAELAGEDSSPLEKLLVERIVVCWLHAYHADVLYARAAGVSLEQGTYLQRQQDRAQRRYLAAIKTLATVRRLALPVKVDVNVAGKLETTPAKAERDLPSRLAGAVSAN